MHFTYPTTKTNMALTVIVATAIIPSVTLMSPALDSLETHCLDQMTKPNGVDCLHSFEIAGERGRTIHTSPRADVHTRAHIYRNYL